MKQFLFIKSATDVVALPASALLRSERTSDTSVSLFFDTTKSGKEATTVVVLSVASGKAVDVLKRLNVLMSNSSNQLTFDDVNNVFPAPNVTGISSLTTTESPSITTGPTGSTGPQGPAGPTGAAGADGTDGADGDGFTGGSYSGVTGIVTFTSDDGIGFSTGDLRGAAGSDGSDGTDGQGVPAGGTTGQLLKKTSGTDYDTEWSSPPITPLAKFSGRYQWTSTDDGERVLTGNTVYGPHNWYSFSTEPPSSQTAMLDYSGSEVVGTTTASLAGYYLFAFGFKNPYSGKKVRVDYSFRCYYSGTAYTTGTPFGLSLWSGNAGATGSTSNQTVTYRGESVDHAMVAPQSGGTTAHHHGSFTTSDAIDDDYVLLCAEHRDSTGINATTYMVVNACLYIVD